MYFLFWVSCNCAIIRFLMYVMCFSNTKSKYCICSCDFMLWFCDNFIQAVRLCAGVQWLRFEMTSLLQFVVHGKACWPMQQSCFALRHSLKRKFSQSCHTLQKGGLLVYDLALAYRCINFTHLQIVKYVWYQNNYHLLIGWNIKQIFIKMYGQFGCS